MPNRDTHIKKGLKYGLPLVILLAAFFSKSLGIAISSIVIAILVLILSSRLPDIIEPAIDPFHRSRFHSFFALIMIAIVGTISTICVILFGANIFTLSLCAFSIGYSIHLILDSKTKGGIPDY